MATRRQLLLASALGVFTPGVFAQPRKTPRVGVLHPGSSKEPLAVQREPFERGLREAGWIPGSTVMIDYRYAEGDPSRLRGLADQLVRLRVDVIVARANSAISAARQATSTIPIVTAAYVGDPAADGVVNSNARPGGNVTGLAGFAIELDSKRLELLKEAFPKIRRVGVVWNPALDGRLGTDRVAHLQATARALGLELQMFEIRTVQDIEPAFARVGKARVDALLVRPDPQVMDSNRAQITGHVAALRLPAIYWFPFFVEAGGLMSYGESLSAFHYRSASYVSRILKGEKAGDLPIEQLTKFDLIVNAKTAKAMGIEIPKAVLFRADRVIE